MEISNRIIILIILLPLFSKVQSQQLVVYDTIPGRQSSEHYICRIKYESEDSQGWRDAFVLQTKAKAENGYFDILHGWTASWIAFESDFSGDNIVVEISKKNGSDITEAMVRPVGHASPAVISNGKAYVTFTEPANVNVDINGQLENNYTGFGYDGPLVHTITLFANPVYHVPDSNNLNVKVLQPGEDINALNRMDWDTLIFAPGIHDVGMPFEMHDNEVLFIPGDAIVKGTIHPLDAWGDAASQNIKVYGSGTISGEDISRDPDDNSSIFKPFTKQAEAAHLEGFVVADPAFHTFNMNSSKENPSAPNIYRNLKILAWRVNSDGVNAFRNSEVSGCFFRTQDDAFYLGSSNVHQYDNVVWNDANGSVLFLPRAIDGSTCSFRDITVIYHRAAWHWWDGGRILCMRELNPGTTLSNVLIQNILVEDPLPAFPPFYGTMVAGTGDITFNNVVIENVHQKHDGVPSRLDPANGKPQNTLTGLDNDRKWENITFKNCYFNDTWLTSFGDGDFDTAYVDTNTVRFEVSYNPPIAEFSSNTSVTAGNSVEFTDLSINSPTSWKWTFEGGIPATSTSRTPEVVYPATGTYNVTLVAINSFGSDTIMVSNYITVNEPVIVPVDTIMNVNAPNQVSPGDSVTLSVDYETTQERDIRAFIQLNSPPWDSYGGKTITVSERAGTLKIGFTIDSTIPIADNAYKFVVDLLPVGGSWPDRIEEIIIPDISVIMHVSGVSIENCLATDLPKGDAHQLSATVSPANAYDKSVEWTSSDPSVATVSADGLLTGVNDGTVNIIVTTNDGSHTDTCKINVATVHVSGVTLNDCPSNELVEGSTHQLTAIVTPENAYDKSLVWDSFDGAIAKIDINGVVEAISEGSTKIVVTTTDGSCKDSCKITVIPVQVSGVSISNCPASAIIIDSTYQFSATVLPDNAKDKTIHWTSSDNAIATISPEGLVTGISSGEVTILAESRNGGFTDSCHIVIEAGTGIEKTGADIQDFVVRIFPIPADEVLNIEFTDERLKNVYLYDLTGRLLNVRETDEKIIQIDLKAFGAQEQLIIKMQAGNSLESYKILIH